MLAMSENSEMRMPIKATLYDHQRRAIWYICRMYGLIDGVTRSRGVALLMEMGTGKSLVAIATIGILYRLGLIRRVLIVAPLSVLGMWQEELRKFADFPFTVTVLRHKSKGKKQKALKNMPNDGLQIVVVNYETAWRLVDDLMVYRADLVIVDEGHKIKNHRARQTEGMIRLGDLAKYRLLLTGTVITNKELDVFAQYRFLNPTIYGTSFFRFRNHYFEMTGYEQHIPVFRKEMSGEFSEKLHSIAFRVTKAECLDLPAITEETRLVDLEEDASRLYESLRRDSYAELGESEITAANILLRSMRLMQLTGGHIKTDDGEIKQVSYAKLQALEDIIDSAERDNQKLVVIAHFVPELDDIEDLLKRKCIQYAVIRGGIQDRDNEVHRFQTDPKCRVFVGQIASAGLGITLTAASTMVFYSLDYNMGNYDQAKARIHRVGQSQNCHYIYLICRGTVDRKVLYALKNKKKLADMMVDDYRAGKDPFALTD